MNLKRLFVAALALVTIATCPQISMAQQSATPQPASGTIQSQFVRPSQAQQNTQVVPNLVFDGQVWYNTGGDVTLPSNVTNVVGDLVILAKGNVTIDHPVTVSGNIYILAGISTAPNSWFTTANFDKKPPTQSGRKSIGFNSNDPKCMSSCSTAVESNYAQQNTGTVTISANLDTGGSGYIAVRTYGTSTSNTISISGSLTAQGWFVLLDAGGNIKTQDITTSKVGGGQSGIVCIRANLRGSANSTFVLSGSTGTNNANGVNGTIHAVNPNSQGEPPPYYTGGINIANGGTGGINIQAVSALDFSIQGSQNGLVELHAPFGTITFPSGTSTLSLDGYGSNGAGAILLDAATVVTNATTLTASDVGTGKRHNVSIAAATITANGATLIKADGFNNNENIDNPNVRFLAQGAIQNQVTFYQSGNLISTNSVLNASGPVTFNGSGAMTVQALGNNTNVHFQFRWPLTNTGSVAFNGGNVVVNANGHSGTNEQGGTVTFDVYNPITLGASTTLTLNANGVGSGNGGTVSINIAGTTPMTLSNVLNNIDQQVSISAIAGISGPNPNGQGGTVTITHAAGTIDPNHSLQGINVPMIIRVDGGPNLGTSGNDGSISLNGVTCQQWKTNAQTYPKVGWDCIDPTGGTNIATLVSAGASFSTTIQFDLAVLVSPPPADPMVGVYAMNSLLQFQQFFGKTQVGPYTNQYGINNRSWLRVASTFKNSSNGDNATLSGSPTIMVGALVHELGHNLDFIWGPPNQLLSSQAAWTSLGSPDFAYMDSQPCNGVFFQATCDAYSATNTNSQIFAIQFPEINNADERFAAMFEHVESVLTGNPPSYQVVPELEKALEALPQQKQYMMNTIASPPNPVN